MDHLFFLLYCFYDSKKCSGNSEGVIALVCFLTWNGIEHTPKEGRTYLLLITQPFATNHAILIRPPSSPICFGESI